MKLNNYIIGILKILASLNNSTIQKQLREETESFKLILDANESVEIGNKSILINNQNIEEKILIEDSNETNVIQINQVQNFISEIEDKITGINHFGISYSCKNLEEELSFYKRLVSGTPLKLFEEKSDSEDKWLFIGNQNNSPMFEIVLKESPLPVSNEWIPHFQIDINTSLTYEEILNVTNLTLAKDFIKWNLDFPNYGTVLGMGILGNINGTKVTLGIGTNIRGKQALKEIV